MTTKIRLGDTDTGRAEVLQIKSTRSKVNFQRGLVSFLRVFFPQEKLKRLKKKAILDNFLQPETRSFGTFRKYFIFYWRFLPDNATQIIARQP